MCLETLCESAVVLRGIGRYADDWAVGSVSAVYDVSATGYARKTHAGPVF